MENYSSAGETFNIKTRKPYTITKQRERWTEDEHNSFLEALKLYGRAWQRIEEHIGTKTAVQIRSHAQKFFTKLEKEAVAKGVPISQALDIEIPPPRPKRKPNYPYPRKTGPKQLPENNTSHQSGIQTLDLEKKPLPETSSHEEEKLENAKTSGEAENATQPPLFSPCGSLSLSSENEIFIPKSVEKPLPGVYREFIPPSTEEEDDPMINHDETNESFITTIQKDNPFIKKTSKTSLFERSSDEGQKPSQPMNELRCVHNYPRHVPVQVVDANIHGVVKNSELSSFQESTLTNSKPSEVNEHHNVNNNLFVNTATASAAATSATATTGLYNNGSCSYQTVHPTFHPLFTPNQEYNTSFLHVSSTISSLIVSSLLQNPAAHAAATFAAKFWHPEASSGDSSSTRDESSPPSVAAIAAATVAAATAWWAAHGLLPVCYPAGYSYGTPVNAINGCTENKVPSHSEADKQKMDVEKVEQPPPAAGAGADADVAELSSSEESDDRKSNTEPVSPVVDTKEMTPVAVGKQVDRSSCGSNTTSSSEIETDALEKHGKKEKEEGKGGSDVNNLASCNNNDSINRIRSNRNTTINPNESWKEVSEEGRLAFQKLFSRQVLPQSFKEKDHQQNQNIMARNGEECALQLDLNSCGESNNNNTLRREKEGLLTMGLKLNVHHTGFKPYKRCSVEAKDNKIVNAAAASAENEEKGAKRMRLEAEAST